MSSLSVRRSLAWMTLAQGGLFVVQFGGSVVMARLLMPYEMGIYALAYAVLGMLGTLRAFGLSNFLIREPALGPAAIATTFTVNAMTAVLSSATIVALAGAGTALLGEAGVGRVMLVLAVLPLVSVFEFLPAALLERRGAFRVVALVNLAKAVTSVTVMILLALHGFSYMSIAWANLASAVLGAACINVAGRRHVSLRFGLHDWRRVTRFGLQMVTISAVGSLAGRLLELVLGRLLGLSALGLYSRASGLNGLLWDNFHLVIGRIVFVDFAEQRRRSISLRDSYLRIVAMITGLLWPAFAGMAVVSGPLILTIYGPNWVGAALPLSMLSLSGLVLTTITMTYEIFVLFGEAARQVRFEIVRTCFGLVLFVLGCLGGLGWAAAARIGEALVAVFVYKKDLKRLTETEAADYRPIYLQSGLLTLVACAPAALLMAANHWSPATPLPRLALAIIVGVALWVAVLRLFRHPLFLEAEKAAYTLLRRPAPVSLPGR